MRARSLAAILLAAATALCAAFLPACRKPSGDEVRVVFGADILSLDPNEKFETVTDSYAINVFEPLLRYDWRGSYVPVLALRWDIADGKTWRFALRPDVRFHDGSLLTARDVVFSIQRVLDRPGSELRPYLQGIEAVRAVDDATVEVVSPRPAGILPGLSFVYVLPAATVAKRGEEEFFRNPAGTGPYRFVAREAGKSLSLTAFEGYWGEQPAFARAQFRFEQDSEAMWAAADERPPAIVVGPGLKSWQVREGRKGIRLIARPGLSVQFLTLAMQPGRPLADPKVRLAVRAALDSRLLVERLTRGRSFTASQFVSPGIVGYNPRMTLPAFEQGLARRLLKEAGHPDGLDLTMTITEGPHPLADELVRQLAVAGIRVKLVVLPFEKFYDRAKACTDDLASIGWICSTGDGAEILDGAFGSAPGPNGSSMSCGYSSPALADLRDRIARTLDARARQRMLQDAMALLMEDLPWIPLFVPEDRYAVRGDLVWEPRPDSEVYLPDVRPR